MKNYTILLVLALILFAACQKVVDPDSLLNTQEKVLITSYISPQDTVLRVNVTRALLAFGTPLSVADQEANRAKFLIKNALVRLSDNEGNATNFTYVDSLDTYLVAASTLSIEGNKEYFLEVTVDDKIFNASCRIPEKVGEIEEQIRMQENEFGYVETEVSLLFDDIIGERNYYMIGGNYRVTRTFQGEEPQTSIGTLFFGTDQFLTDAVEDGAPLAGKSQGNLSFSSEVDNISGSVTLQVAHLDEIIFQNFRTASVNSTNEGNPFVEYAIAPTNFSDDGAVGVFAGYQLTVKTVDIDF